MKHIAMAMVLVAAATETAEAKRVPYVEITCTVEVRVKTAPFRSQEIAQNSSWVWSTASPPSVYAMVTLTNTGARAAKVTATTELHKLTSSGSTLVDFVNSSGTALPDGTFPVTVAVPANGSEKIGPYWIRNLFSTVKYDVTALGDDPAIRGTGNKCSRVFTIIAPPA